jgi:hypothetical protein
MYMDYFPLPFGELELQWKTSYVSLRESNLMNLWELPFFGTTGEIAQCTKFLISHKHNSSPWLDREYPIHVHDIHQLTGLSIESEDVTGGFQGS